MATTDLTLAFVAKLVAKAGLEDEVAGFLAGAVDLANAEAGTVVWFALRTDAQTFWIVDAFPSEDARQAHITGPIADRLLQPGRWTSTCSATTRSGDAPSSRPASPACASTSTSGCWTRPPRSWPRPTSSASPASATPSTTCSSRAAS